MTVCIPADEMGTSESTVHNGSTKLAHAESGRITHYEMRYMFSGQRRKEKAEKQKIRSNLGGCGH